MGRELISAGCSSRYRSPCKDSLRSRQSELRHHNLQVLLVAFEERLTVHTRKNLVDVQYYDDEAMTQQAWEDLISNRQKLAFKLPSRENIGSMIWAKPRKSRSYIVFVVWYLMHLVLFDSRYCWSQFLTAKATSRRSHVAALDDSSTLDPLHTLARVVRKASNQEFLAYGSGT